MTFQITPTMSAILTACDSDLFKQVLEPLECICVDCVGFFETTLLVLRDELLIMPRRKCPALILKTKLIHYFWLEILSVTMNIVYGLYILQYFLTFILFKHQLLDLVFHMRLVT